eukprot:COSAG02_NODE_434_length_22429_cov_15.013704_1_plen_1838_part_10
MAGVVFDDLDVEAQEPEPELDSMPGQVPHQHQPDPPTTQQGRSDLAPAEQQDAQNRAAVLFPESECSCTRTYMPALAITALLVLFLALTTSASQSRPPGLEVAPPQLEPAPAPEPAPEPEPEPEPEPVYLENPCPGHFSEPVTANHPAFRAWATKPNSERGTAPATDQPLPAWLSPRDGDFPCEPVQLRRGTTIPVDRCGARGECCTCCLDGELSPWDAWTHCRDAAVAAGWRSHTYYDSDGDAHNPVGGARCETLQATSGVAWKDKWNRECDAYTTQCYRGALRALGGWLQGDDDPEQLSTYLNSPETYDRQFFESILPSFEEMAPTTGPFEGISALEACCECGGGRVPPPPPEPEPEPDPEPEPEQRRTTRGNVDKHGRDLPLPPPPRPPIQYTPTQLVLITSTWAGLVMIILAVVAYNCIVCAGQQGVGGDNSGQMQMKWWNQRKNLLAIYSMYCWGVGVSEQGIAKPWRYLWHSSWSALAVVLNWLGMYVLWARNAEYVTAAKSASHPTDSCDRPLPGQLALLYCYWYLVQIVRNVIAFQTGYCVSRHYMLACKPFTEESDDEDDGDETAAVDRKRRSTWPSVCGHTAPVWRVLGYIATRSLPLLSFWRFDWGRRAKTTTRFALVRMALYGAGRPSAKGAAQGPASLDISTAHSSAAHEKAKSFNMATLLFEGAQRVDIVFGLLHVFGAIIAMLCLMYPALARSLPGCVSGADWMAAFVAGWTTTSLWLATRQAGISAAVVCFIAQPQHLAFINSRKYTAAHGEWPRPSSEVEFQYPGDYVFEHLLDSGDFFMANKSQYSRQQRAAIHSAREESVQRLREEEDLVKAWARWVDGHAKDSVFNEIIHKVGVMSPEDIVLLLTDIEHKLRQNHSQHESLKLQNKSDDGTGPRLKSLAATWQWNPSIPLAALIAGHKAGLKCAAAARKQHAIPTWANEMPIIESPYYSNLASSTDQNLWRNSEPLRSYDVFISYRKAEHKDIAVALFDELNESNKSSDTDDKIAVFRDEVCLPEGMWLDNFLAAIGSAKVIVLIVSEKLFSEFHQADTEQDNVLLEHEYALHMKGTGTADIFLVQVGAAGPLEDWLRIIGMTDQDQGKFVQELDTCGNHDHTPTMSSLSKLPENERMHVCRACKLEYKEFERRLKAAEFHWKSVSNLSYPLQRHFSHCTMALESVDSTVKPVFNMQWKKEVGNSNSTCLQQKDLSDRNSEIFKSELVEPVREMLRSAKEEPNGCWYEYKTRWKQAVYNVEKDAELKECWADNPKVTKAQWRDKVKRAVTEARVLPSVHFGTNPLGTENPCASCECKAEHAIFDPARKRYVLEDGAKLILWWDKKMNNTPGLDSIRVSQVRTACRIYESCRKVLQDILGTERNEQQCTKRMIVCTLDKFKLEIESLGQKGRSADNFPRDPADPKKRFDVHGVLLSWALIDSCKSCKDAFSERARTYPKPETASEEWVSAAKAEYIILCRLHAARCTTVRDSRKLFAEGNFEGATQKVRAAIESCPETEPVWVQREKKRLDDDFPSLSPSVPGWEIAIAERVLGELKKSLELLEADIKAAKARQEKDRNPIYTHGQMDHEVGVPKSQDNVLVMPGHSCVATEQPDPDQLKRTMSAGEISFRNELDDPHLKLAEYTPSLRKEGYISMQDIFQIETEQFDDESANGKPVLSNGTVETLTNLAELIGMKPPELRRLKTAWEDMRSHDQKLEEKAEKHKEKLKTIELKMQLAEKRNADHTEIEAQLAHAETTMETAQLEAEFKAEDMELRRTREEQRQESKNRLELRKQLRAIVGQFYGDWDTDHNGAISPTELRDYMLHLFGLNADVDQDVADLMVKMDTNQ